MRSLTRQANAARLSDRSAFRPEARSLRVRKRMHCGLADLQQCLEVFELHLKNRVWDTFETKIRSLEKTTSLLCAYQFLLQG